jgi:probable F420-dependent oxidoreductase
VLLAREAATLDLLTDGRFEPGLGTGVSATEFEQMGIPFASAGARVEQLEETLQIMKRLFTEETVSFSGKHFTISELKGYPKPVQKPHPPILVAGSGERMLKIAAREADIIAIGTRISAHGADPLDPTMEQKIAWIKEAAGDRFAHVELCQTSFGIEITDSETAPSAMQGGWSVPKTQLTTRDAIAHLLEQREQYGFSYLQVSTGQIENFAPVVEQLAGK